MFWVIWAWMRSAYGPFPRTLCRAGLPGGDLSGPVRSRHRHQGTGPVHAGVTTLYFEAEREDGLQQAGYSKERRVDPQSIVGLLGDRHGFPFQVGCWKSNRAETTAIIPVVEAFQAGHGMRSSSLSPTPACSQPLTIVFNGLCEPLWRDWH